NIYSPNDPILEFCEKCITMLNSYKLENNFVYAWEKFKLVRDISQDKDKVAKIEQDLIEHNLKYIHYLMKKSYYSTALKEINILLLNKETKDNIKLKKKIIRIMNLYYYCGSMLGSLTIFGLIYLIKWKEYYEKIFFNGDYFYIILGMCNAFFVGLFFRLIFSFRIEDNKKRTGISFLVSFITMILMFIYSEEIRRFSMLIYVMIMNTFK
ncbi:MAG: hypothetical protein SNJ64_06945, partial [Endomicrobiia bacterium]